MTNSEAIEFIRAHREEVADMIREAYKESLTESDYYSEKVLVYGSELVHWSHEYGCWSQAEQDGDAICIYSVRGAGDDDITDDTVESLLDTLDVDEEIESTIMDLRY